MFSVVIPLYNKEKSIARTIESVLAQTYTDFELIIIDDGSTDDSVIKVAQFTDKRINLIKKDNGGVSSARNEGIRNAQGDYISFLDGDDLWDKSYLEEVQKMTELFPSAGIIGVGLGVSHNGVISFCHPDFKEGECVLVDVPWKLSATCWTGSSTTIKKTVFNNVGLFDERMAYGEDHDMWWRVLLHYPGAYYCKPLAFYEQDAENRAMTRMIPFEKHLPFFIEKYADYRSENPEFRKFVDRECIYKMFQYAGSSKYKKDLKRVFDQIDFSQQKKSMKLRFIFPNLYRFYRKLAGNRQ